MPSVIQQIKDKVSDKVDQTASLSPIRRSSPNGSRTNERVIPPEPIQLQTEGEATDMEADPALQAHNLSRAAKMVPALQWDERLAHDAASYAQLLASTGKFEHASQETQGENLYWSTAQDPKFEDAVSSWMDEEKKYNGEAIGQGNLQDWGHFSQCMWHSTTHVGMGKARSRDGATYIVARYWPRGNMYGSRPF